MRVSTSILRWGRTANSDIHPQKGEHEQGFGLRTSEEQACMSPGRACGRGSSVPQVGEGIVTGERNQDFPFLPRIYSQALHTVPTGSGQKMVNPYKISSEALEYT